MSIQMPDLDNISPGSLVNIGQVVDDVLGLFEGERIPLASHDQVTKIIAQLSMLGGIIGAMQKSQESVTDALLAGNTAPYKKFDELLHGIGVFNK